MPARGSYSKNAKPKSVQARKYLRKTAKQRAARNRARAAAVKRGAVSKGDGRVVHHVKPLSKGGSPNGRTQVQSRSSSVAEGGRLRRRPKKKVARRKR